MYYSAIVTSTDDAKCENRINVFVPSLMHKFKFNVDEELEKELNVALNTELTDDLSQLSKVNKKIFEKYAILASPANQNGSKSNGASLSPEKGDNVQVFFMDEDWSQCYYAQGMSPYVEGFTMDYGALLEDEGNAASPTNKHKHKVLYKSAKDSIIAINDNDEKESIMIKTVSNKLEIQKNSNRNDIGLETGGGYICRLDEKGKIITIKTKSNDSIVFTEGASIAIKSPLITLN